MNFPMLRTFFIVFLLSLATSFNPTGRDNPTANASPQSINTANAFATVITPHPGVKSIWGGARDTIILNNDGTVWTMGINNCVLGTGSCGKLGDGTTSERHVPVQVHGPGNIGYLDSINAIMGGEHDNYALKSDGTVWAWGGNFAGQLGDGTWTNSVLPVQVSGLTSVKLLGGRGYHNLAVKSDGTIWSWGWNKFGGLGHDTSATPCPAIPPNGPLYGSCSNVPVLVSGVSNPLSVTGGGFFSLALMPDHTLMAWGANESGQLGDGSYTSRPVPVAVSPTLTHVTQVSGGWKHAIALDLDGRVWTWGDNANGEIGNGTTSTKGINLPYQVPGLTHIIAVSAGDSYSAALKDDGTVWTWGYNHFGQLGDGTFIDRSAPYQVQGVSNVVFLAARDYHTMVLTADGSVLGWGSDENGELGNNDIKDMANPVQTLFPAYSKKLFFLPLTLTLP